MKTLQAARLLSLLLAPVLLPGLAGCAGNQAPPKESASAPRPQPLQLMDHQGDRTSTLSSKNANWAYGKKLRAGQFAEPPLCRRAKARKESHEEPDDHYDRCYALCRVGDLASNHESRVSGARVV